MHAAVDGRHSHSPPSSTAAASDAAVAMVVPGPP